MVGEEEILFRSLNLKIDQGRDIFQALMCGHPLQWSILSRGITFVLAAWKHKPLFGAASRIVIQESSIPSFLYVYVRAL